MENFVNFCRLLLSKVAGPSLAWQNSTAGEREALFFYGQANEVGVVAMTDWEASTRDDEAIDYAA